MIRKEEKKKLFSDIFLKEEKLLRTIDSNPCDKIKEKYDFFDIFVNYKNYFIKYLYDEILEKKLKSNRLNVKNNILYGGCLGLVIILGVSVKHFVFNEINLLNFLLSTMGVSLAVGIIAKDYVIAYFKARGEYKDYLKRIDNTLDKNYVDEKVKDLIYNNCYVKKNVDEKNTDDVYLENDNFYQYKIDDYYDVLPSEEKIKSWQRKRTK